MKNSLCWLCLMLVWLAGCSDFSSPNVPRLAMDDVYYIPEMEYRVPRGNMVFGVRSTSSATHVEFLAYDLVAETVSWSIEIPIEDSRGLLVGEGMAFVIGGYQYDEWYIYAISIEDRAIQWEVQTTHVADPLLVDGSLFYSDEGTLFVREARTGEELRRWVGFPTITMADGFGSTIYAKGKLLF